MSVKASAWAWEQQLDAPPAAKLVLLAIADRADEEGYCWPKVPTIMAKTGLSKSTVIRNLNWLKSNQYIERGSRFTESGRQTSSWTRLRMVQTELHLEGGSDSDTPGSQFDTHPQIGVSEWDGEGVTHDTPEGVTGDTPKEETSEDPPKETGTAPPSAPSRGGSNGGRERLLAYTELDPAVLDAIPDGGPGWEERLLAAFHPGSTTRPGVTKLWGRVRPEDRAAVFRQALEDYADPSKGQRGPYKPRRMERFLESAVGEYLRPAKIGGMSPADERRREQERAASGRPGTPTLERLSLPTFEPPRDQELEEAEAWLETLPPPRRRAIEKEIDEGLKAEFGRTDGLRAAVRRRIELVKKHQHDKAKPTGALTA